MSDYTPPLRDIRFVLEHIASIGELAELDDYRHADADMVSGLLEEAGRFAAQAIAPTNRPGDEQGSVLHGDGEVRTPEGFQQVYRQYVEAGWGAVPFDPDYGGGGFPHLVGHAIKELVTSANMAFSLGPLLTTGAVVMMQAHADEEQKQTYLPKLISGEWTGTMNLTEPQAGSDVGALTTRAVPQDDGTYRITGQKIFITYGEHDLADQIVHLVLARLPDAPAGTRGISVFIVPKYLVNDDGSLGARNDVKCISIEHKLGIHASPTCTMAYGEDGEGAIGYLIGEPHRGMRYMFTMMNDARLGVGVEGLAVAERAYQQAVAYAQERRQGQAPGMPKNEQVPIIEHADVRRMLMTMRAYIEAMRCLTYANAEAIDYAERHPDDEVRRQQQMRADLLTPISKSWCTDLGVELSSIGVQVHGGMGYVEETGAAQHYRDARIAPIYEGTNGIQAMDLVGRKLPMDGGRFVQSFIADLQESAKDIGEDELATVRERLVDGIEALATATDWILSRQEQLQDVLSAATPYLRLFGTVLGGWFLARSAQAAMAELDAGGADRDFLEAKVVTARFYAQNLLPQARGLLGAVTAGADDLFALDERQLAG